MRFCAAVVLSALVGIPVAAQTRPDLSGTWTIDTARSDPAPAVSPGRGAAGRGRGGAPSNQIVVRQTATEISIARGAQNLTFQFDGTDTFWFQQGEIRATLAWDGDKAVISWRKEVFTPATGAYVNTTGKDVYSLAGSELRQDSTTVSPTGTTTSKTVYTKSP